MTKKLSEIQFETDKEKFRSELNIELLIDYQDYINAISKYPYKCLKCGYEDEKEYYSLKSGYGCVVCAGQKITEEIFNKDKQIFRRDLFIELLVEYKEYGKVAYKYSYRCLKCGYEGKKTYNKLKLGRGCPVCAGNKITKEMFEKDKENIKNKLNIELLICFDEYKGNKIKYPCRCLKCGYEDSKKYDNLKGGRGCLNCRANSFVSKAEEEIKEFIQKFYEKEIVTSDRKILKGGELDIYLPELNLAFEFNGIYWHSDSHKSKKYHYNKYKRCFNKNIRLYQIYEDEWRDNQELIKEHIKNLIENKEEIYDFSDNYIEVDLDHGYDINKYLNNNYIIKEIRENIMMKDDKYKIYGSGLMILEKNIIGE